MSVRMLSVCSRLETLLPSGLETSGQRAYWWYIGFSQISFFCLIYWFVWAALIRHGGLYDLPEQDWAVWEGVPALPEQDWSILLRQIKHTSYPDKSCSGGRFIYGDGNYCNTVGQRDSGDNINKDTEAGQDLFYDRFGKIFLAHSAQPRAWYTNTVMNNWITLGVRDLPPLLALRRVQAQTVRDGSSSHKIDYITSKDINIWPLVLIGGFKLERGSRLV